MATSTITTVTTTTIDNDCAARASTTTVQAAAIPAHQQDRLMCSPSLNQPHLLVQQQEEQSDAPSSPHQDFPPPSGAQTSYTRRTSLMGAIATLKGYMRRSGDTKLSKDAACRSVDVSRAGPNPINPFFPNSATDVKRTHSDSDLSARIRRPPTLRSSARSLKGRKHSERENQDEFFRVPDLFENDRVHSATAPPAAFGAVGVFGVCDGHGGGACSAFVAKEVSAHIAASSAWAQLRIDATPAASDGGGGGGADGNIGQRCWKGNPTARGDGGVCFLPPLPRVMREALLDGFCRTEKAFNEFADTHKDNSGSTAVVAMVCDSWVVIANVGDSSGLFYNENAWVARNGERSVQTKVCTAGGGAPARELPVPLIDGLCFAFSSPAWVQILASVDG